MAPPDAFIAISQSGETADTLEPLQEAKQKGLLTPGIVNVIGSAIARETDAGIYTHSGPEIAVASTKASTSQLAALALDALLGASEVCRWSPVNVSQELKKLPALIVETVRVAPQVEKLAKFTQISGYVFWAENITTGSVGRVPAQRTFIFRQKVCRR